jgi:hypothetical protein
MNSASASLLAIFTLAACGTAITQTGINAPPHAMTSRSPASVEIFSSGPPTRPHVDVAVLEGQQQSEWSLDNQSDIIRQLRARAAEMGCDGLVITGPDNGAAGNRDYTTTLHGFLATCIAYTQ